tara:strand:+ start:6860 stop:7474 length:615 start_codon:yes stop_codon:yes gene_type:complete
MVNDDHLKLAGQFIFPAFRGKYEGISDTLDIRKTKYYKPTGGQTTDIHKQDYFQELIKLIQISVLSIAEDFYLAKQGYEVEVVSMWLNSKPKGLNHPPHNHTNTFISGVLYLDGEVQAYPSLKLLRPYQLPIVPRVNKFNEINSNVIELLTAKDEVVFFPSYILHFVETNLNEKPRISIAFDTLLRGKYGEIQKNGVPFGDFKI